MSDTSHGTSGTSFTLKDVSYATSYPSFTLSDTSHRTSDTSFYGIRTSYILLCLSIAMLCGNKKYKSPEVFLSSGLLALKKTQLILIPPNQKLHSLYYQSLGKRYCKNLFWKRLSLYLSKYPSLLLFLFYQQSNRRQNGPEGL